MVSVGYLVVSCPEVRAGGVKGEAEDGPCCLAAPIFYCHPCRNVEDPHLCLTVAYLRMGLVKELMALLYSTCMCTCVYVCVCVCLYVCGYDSVCMYCAYVLSVRRYVSVCMFCVCRCVVCVRICAMYALCMRVCVFLQR